MPVGLFAADESLINLDNAGQLFDLPSASLAKPLQHEPCRFLSDSDFLRKLHGTDTLPRSDHKVHGINPLVKRHMGPLENRASADREIQFAGVAAVVAAFAGRDA